MTFDSPRARQAARALLARQMPQADDPTSVAAALYRAYADVANNLRRSVGDDGCDAVLLRALAYVEPLHPAAKDLRRTATALVDIQQIAAAIATHGEPAIREALEATFAAVIDLLTRLVGEGMAMSLIDPSPTSQSRSTHDKDEA